MQENFNVGLINSASHIVTKADLAITFRSGNLPVLATPALVAFMEAAAHEMLLPYMQDEEGTVGTLMEIQHLKASLEGQNITIKAVLKEIDSRKFVFEIEAYDEIGLIGKANHERFLIKAPAFLKKAEDRRLSI